MSWNRRLALILSGALILGAVTLAAMAFVLRQSDAATQPAERAADQAPGQAAAQALSQTLGQALAQSDAQAAIPAVLEQVYSAFALQDEGAIYDALAGAVTGPLIETLYLQRRSAQVADHAEDGEATLLGVEVFDVTPLDGTHSYAVAWRVIGRVRHTAHVHERINIYTANLTVAQTDGEWKLTAFTLKDNIRADTPMFTGGE